MLVGLIVPGAAAAVALAAYAVGWEPYRPRLARRRVAVPAGWPRLSVLHVSDVHAQRGQGRLLRAQRALLAGLEPDLLVVTGDVCETPQDVPAALTVLGQVRPRLGTFVVLGNHEHGVHGPDRARGRLPLPGRLLHALAERVLKERRLAPGQQWPIARALGSVDGIQVLVNEGRRIASDGRTLWIAGCDSAWGGQPNMPAAFAGREPDEPSLVLAHEPELAFDAEALGADLVLAGHTHGGQVRLPFIGAPYSHRVDRRVRIAAGFQRLGHGLLHVSPGLGQTIPLRLGCPPEATWLDCVPATAAPAAAHSGTWQTASTLLPSGSRTKAP